jgi:hypothetical protein
MLSDQIQNLMQKYLHKYSRTQPTIHHLTSGLQIRTQAANQTTKFGKLKFNGLETVWLQIKLPYKPPIVLARLTETQEKQKYEFETPYLEQYKDVILKHLSSIEKIAT